MTTTSQSDCERPRTVNTLCKEIIEPGKTMKIVKFSVPKKRLCQCAKAFED